MRTSFQVLLAVLWSAELALCAWTPIRSTESVRVELPVAPNEFVTACVVQRDIDLTISIATSSTTAFVNGGAFGRECVHALTGSDTKLSLTIEPVEKRFGRGRYFLRPLSRRPVLPRDEAALSAQQHAWTARGLKDRAERSSLEAAVAQYETAAGLARQAGDLRREAECRLAMGGLLANLGRYQLADEQYRRSLKAWTVLAEPGKILDAKLDWQRLLDLLDRGQPLISIADALAAWRKIGDQRGMASAARGLARYYGSIPDYGRALSQLAESRRMCVAIDDLPCEIKAIEISWSFLQKQQRLQAALEVAQRHYELADRLDDDRARAAAFSALGNVYFAMGEYQKCIVSFTAGRELRQRQGDEATVINLDASISRAMVGLGRFDEALDLVKAALGRSDQVHQSISNPIWRSEIRGDHLSAAYLNAVAMKAMTEGGDAALRQGLLDIDRVTGRFLLERFPTQNLQADLRSLLGSDDVAIIMTYAEETLTVWAFTQRDVQVIRRPLKGGTLGKIIAWANRISGSTKPDDTLAEVSRQLLSPLESVLAHKRLILGLNSFFQRIPFAALLDPATRYRKPLAEGHEIVHMPSFLFLDASRAEWRNRGMSGPVRIAALGDPVYSTMDLRIAGRSVSGQSDQGLVQATRGTFGSAVIPRLSFTHREIQDIVHLAGSRSTPFLGFQAARSLFTSDRLVGFDVVHIAAHGLFDPFEPENSGVVLSVLDSNGQRVPGYVRLSDVLDRERPHRLVVLSACQTGLGKHLGGEAALGLTTALLRAGTRAVVSSLWKVDDEATAATMHYFYEAYLVRGQPPSAALAEAQRKIRSVPKWSDPYYWAGFIFTGDWTP